MVSVLCVTAAFFALAPSPEPQLFSPHVSYDEPPRNSELLLEYSPREIYVDYVEAEGYAVAIRERISGLEDVMKNWYEQMRLEKDSSYNAEVWQAMTVALTEITYKLLERWDAMERNARISSVCGDLVLLFMAAMLLSILCRWTCTSRRQTDPLVIDAEPVKV